MKKSINIFFLLTLILVISACDKEYESPVPETFNNGKALLKVVYASAYNARDSVQIKLNDVRVSHTFIGNSTTNLPTPFPGGGLNTGGSNFPYYLEVNPGNTKVFVSTPKKLTNIDSIIRYSGFINLDADEKYTAFITDTTINARLVLVKENRDSVANGLSRFKFVNLIPNQPAIDLYWQSTLVAGAVAYGTASPEFTIAAGQTGKWSLRIAGASPTSTALVTYPTGTTNMTIPNRRIMTVFSKGYTGATGARVPTVHLLYN